MSDRIGVSGKIAHAFIQSKLTPLIVIASLLLGLFAVVVTPREEEPQIVVPMIDVIVTYPGASAREVEERVTRPMEKLLWEIQGVEYIYSIVKPGFNLTIVRFYVGESMEDSLVKLYNKLMSNSTGSPRRIPADGQGQVHRRRAHPRAHPLERKPPHLGLRAAAGGPRALHGDQEGPERRRVHRYRRPAPPGKGHPRPGKAQGVQRLGLPDNGSPGQVERFPAVRRLPLTATARSSSTRGGC